MIPRSVAPPSQSANSSSGEAQARVRKSVVAVLSGGSGGTGFVALDNGLIVTSWRAVGFYSEVMLRYDDGRRATGRVVHVNAERDVAFVMPTAVFSAPRLSLRTNALPRMGEQVSVLIASAASPLTAAFATVSSESQGGGPAALDPDLASRTGRGGCPAIDASGQVIGVITAGPHAGRGVNERSCRLFPIGFVARDMRPFDIAASDIGDRQLVYRCPSCSEAFTAEHDRCQACGALLPHAYEMPANMIGAERVVRDALAALDIVSNRVRIGPRVWRVLLRGAGKEGPPTEVLVQIDDAALQIMLRVAVVRLPTTNHEPFYRLLLTANDMSTGDCKLSLSGDTVMLTFAEPVVAFAGEHDMAGLFRDVVQLATQYRSALSEHFGAEPIRNDNI
ncbi:MAG TPA: serine protease [Polyangium sp.]|nr:serine protease [Polyangium sp.]